MEPKDLIKRLSLILSAKVLFINEEDISFALKKKIKIGDMPLYKTNRSKKEVVETIIFFEFEGDEITPLSSFIKKGEQIDDILYKHVLMAWLDDHDRRTKEDNEILFKLTAYLLED